MPSHEWALGTGFCAEELCGAMLVLGAMDWSRFDTRPPLAGDVLIKLLTLTARSLLLMLLLVAAFGDEFERML